MCCFPRRQLGSLASSDNNAYAETFAELQQCFGVQHVAAAGSVCRQAPQEQTERLCASHTCEVCKAALPNSYPAQFSGCAGLTNQVPCCAALGVEGVHLVHVSAALQFLRQHGSTSTDVALQSITCVFVCAHLGVYVLADCRLGEVLAGKDRGDRGPSGKQFFMSQEAAGRIEVSSQQLCL